MRSCNMMDVTVVIVWIMCWISSRSVSKAFNVRRSTPRLLLLSDVATPSIVFDISSLQKRLSSATTKHNNNDDCIPSIHLDKYNITLVPIPVNDNKKNNNNENRDSFSTVECTNNDEPICWSQLYPTENENENESLLFKKLSLDEFMYFHSSVIQAKDDTSGTTTNFLAQLDLTLSKDLTMTKETSPLLLQLQLVLGLNNHHVGSYYWARSAGRGACMEAPGIQFIPSNGILCWQQDAGPTQCNSNDGKRSEWVNFLNIGDTVQLIIINPPHNNKQQQHGDFRQDLLLQLLQPKSKTTKPMKLFGITSKGRPMGSEPAVICQWICK